MIVLFSPQHASMPRHLFYKSDKSLVQNLRLNGLQSSRGENEQSCPRLKGLFHPSSILPRFEML